MGYLTILRDLSADRKTSQIQEPGARSQESGVSASGLPGRVFVNPDSRCLIPGPLLLAPGS
jgi:hypothetical protein